MLEPLSKSSVPICTTQGSRPPRKRPLTSAAWASLGVVLCAMLATGCGGDTNGGGGGGDDDGGAASGPPKLSDVYKDILGRNCSGPLCHSSAVGGNLVMSSPATAYDNLVGQPAAGDKCGDSGLTRVVPGDAEASLLYLKLTNTADCGDAMPVTGPLESAQIDEIKAWIEAGAKND
jgi:hypothetical protein